MFDAIGHGLNNAKLNLKSLNVVHANRGTELVHCLANKSKIFELAVNNEPSASEPHGTPLLPLWPTLYEVDPQDADIIMGLIIIPEIHHGIDNGIDKFGDRFIL